MEGQKVKLNQHRQLLNDIWDKVEGTRDEGQKEYAQDIENVFANFERVGEQLTIDRQQVLWVYLYKHIDGIASFIKGHKSQREDVRGRIVDVIVYLTLLWGMIDEDENGIEENAEHMAEMKSKFKAEWKAEPDRFKEDDN